MYRQIVLAGLPYCCSLSGFDRENLNDAQPSESAKWVQVRPTRTAVVVKTYKYLVPGISWCVVPGTNSLRVGSAPISDDRAHIVTQQVVMVFALSFVSWILEGTLVLLTEMD